MLPKLILKLKKQFFSYALIFLGVCSSYERAATEAENLHINVTQNGQQYFASFVFSSL